MNKNHKSVKKIALLGLLTSLCTVARILISPLPNVQPVTDTIMIITLVMGFRDGLTLAVLTMLVSNLYLGFGIWTVPQIFAYAVCVMTVFFFSKCLPLSKWWWLQLAVSGFLGFEYGFAVSLGMAVIGSAPAFVAYWISGLLYDFYHCVGNLIFYPLLYFPLKKLLQDYQRRY